MNITGLGLTDITSEVDRYIAWPGQALGYKMGSLMINATKGTLQSAMQAAGLAWDVRVFHDTVIGNGAMPLDLMQKTVYRSFCTRYGLTQPFCP